MIPGTSIGISQAISAALFVICGIVVTVKRTMAKKRAAIRKRRREQDYEAEERAAREAEGREDDRGTETVPEDKEASEKAGPPDQQPGGPAEKHEDQPET